MVDRETFQSNVDYTTVLDNFEGPLDLLLYLINREEIEIRDIYVSQVMDQFLDYMKGLPYIDVEKVADYLSIAATIIKIKVQSLVPNPDDESEEAMDLAAEKEGLVLALEAEYKRLKEEATKLKELETVGYFFKEPDKSVEEVKTVFLLDNLTLEGLVSAFSSLLIKQDNARAAEAVREIPRDEFTVSQKITTILESLEERESVEFEELFTKDFTKSEIVTTFQAMLELLKHQYLRVTQDDTFGKITITLNPDRDGEDTLGQIDEYN